MKNQFRLNCSFFLLISFLALSCSKKYTHYPYIKKDDFRSKSSFGPMSSEERSIQRDEDFNNTTRTLPENQDENKSSTLSKKTSQTPPKLLRGRIDKEKFCEGQIFFSKNSFDITNSSLSGLVRQTCPGSKYLLDTKITYSWWTMIVYSQSCVEIKAYCPKN